jgi:hypothetical protein
MAPNPLSRKIPPLLMRIVTPPKASSAVFITADPSVTEELFTTALPPPPTLFAVVRMWCRKGQSTRTCVNLINDLLRRLFVNIVHYDIRAAETVEQRVPRGEDALPTTSSTRRGRTDALPRPPPAPVTTTTCPLKERAIGGRKEERSGVE